jgi:anti-sigma28 factor (negative regulator of flagellin synthesis)
MSENMITTNGFLPAVGYNFAEAFAIANPENSATLTQVIAANGVGTATGPIEVEVIKTLSKTGASGGKAEGSEASASEKSSKATIKNACEIYMKTAEVSGTAHAINQASYSDELNDRIAEIKEDINYNMLNGVLSETDPRKMKGFVKFAANTVAVEGDVMSEVELDKAIQKLNTKANVYLAVNPADKLAVQTNLIGDKAAVNLTSETVVAGLNINKYVSAQGVTVKIYTEPALPTGTCLLYDMAKAKYKELRAMEVVPLAKTGDFDRAMVRTEVTCMINPASAVVLEKG